MALYSGLETEGMKALRCSLKFQPHWTYKPEVLTLTPARLVVPMDGCPPKKVQFHGCKVILLRGGSVSEQVMPPMLIVAGPCYYTKNDKRDFEIAMRTKAQSLLMKLPPNGQFDWPDYHACETCPGCGIRAKPGGSKERYWLIFQLLLQRADDAELGIRIMCRLTCEDCFESMTDGEHIQVRTGSSSTKSVPLLDAIEEQGSITWLRDGQMSARGVLDGIYMNAWQLYTSWELTGTWQALSNYFGDTLSEATGGRIGFSPQKIAPPNTYWEMDQIPNKEGRKCDGPDCPNVHGNRRAPEPGKKKGKKVRLSECLGCYDTMYCSEKCQHAAWPDHKEACKEVQRKRKEDEEKKKAREKLDEEAKMEAALASFVPLSVTPQGGGGPRKKKGKKGGGKKKKGKK